MPAAGAAVAACSLGANHLVVGEDVSDLAGDLEHRRGSAGRCPYLVELEQVLVHQKRHGFGIPERRNPADRGEVADTSDLTIWAFEQPSARAASSAVRMDSGNSTTVRPRPR
jgi:hypothetical protein